MKPTVVILWITNLLLPLFSVGQNFFWKQYTVDDGLTSDIVKSVVEDQYGFFWVATDEGMVRYDGNTFTPYKKLNSLYLKGFVQSSEYGLVLFGDLDMLRFRGVDGNSEPEKVIELSRVPTDSTISYPKLIYEDKQQNLWISESQSVVRFREGKIKRYEFSIDNRTPQFLRSFSIFEDLKGDLYVSSFQGNIFKYSMEKDRFDGYEIKFPAGIEFAKIFEDRVLIGAQDGVYEAALLESGGIDTPRLLFEVKEVSYIEKISGGRFFVATRGKTHFIIGRELKSVTAVPIEVSNVNHVYVSREKDIWLSSNEGLFLLKENTFDQIGYEHNFIEAFASGADSIVYYATSKKLLHYNLSTGEEKVLLSIEDGYFQDLLYTDDGLWVANAFQAILLRDGSTVRTYDFEDDKHFVVQIEEDAEGSIWFSVPGNPEVYQVNQNKKLVKHSISISENGVIQVLLPTSDGIFVGASGSDFIFFKSYSEDSFIPLTISNDRQNLKDFELYDMAYDGHVIYLGTSLGVLRYEIASQNLDRLISGQENLALPAKSVSMYQDSMLLCSNYNGLMLYDLGSETVVRFNQNHGLPSRSIHSQSIYVEGQQVFVGTSEGLAVNDSSLLGLSKTTQPKLLQVYVNSFDRPYEENMLVKYGNVLSFDIYSITFPKEDVNYQYRLDADSPWQNVKRKIELVDLSTGEYRLEVRAKKYGAWAWSDSLVIPFAVDQPYWLKWWFLTIVVVGLLGVIVVTNWIVRAKDKMEKLRLQAMVREKTRDLSAANQKLSKMNEEKSHLMRIVAHDLKSPLGNIVSLTNLITEEVEEPEHLRYLEMMHQSSSGLIDMINNFLDINRIESGEFKFEIKPVDVSRILFDICSRFEIGARQKNIQINSQIAPAVCAELDENGFSQVVENLISNAIKFSPFRSEVSIILKQDKGFACLEVNDKGPGFTEEDKIRLFGKYQRLSAKPTNNESSSGLGLSIVKKFVSAMGGEIWIESTYGMGASFFVKFKIAEQKEVPRKTFAD